MKKKQNKDKRVGIRMDQETKELAEKIAAQEGYTLSSFILHHIKKVLTQYKRTTKS